MGSSGTTKKKSQEADLALIKKGFLSVRVYNKMEWFVGFLLNQKLDNLSGML